MLGYPIMAYGKPTTFVDCKNAIIDSGNVGPDLVGASGGWGTEDRGRALCGRTGPNLCTKWAGHNGSPISFSLFAFASYCTIRQT
jgi:hypothetical protein